MQLLEKCLNDYTGNPVSAVLSADVRLGEGIFAKNAFAEIQTTIFNLLTVARIDNQRPLAKLV